MSGLHVSFARAAPYRYRPEQGIDELASYRTIGDGSVRTSWPRTKRHCAGTSPFPARTSTTSSAGWDGLRAPTAPRSSMALSLGWSAGSRQSHEAGDHVLVVAEVIDTGVDHSGRPVIFYRGGFGRFEP